MSANKPFEKISFLARYLISSDSDELIRMFSDLATYKHNLPENNRFTVNADQPGHNGRQLLSHDEKQLASITIRDKLYLEGHGNPYSFEGLSPSQLAEGLYLCGLKEVGAIKFHSCHIGREDYLEKLGVELTHRGIKHGYLAASRDFVHLDHSHEQIVHMPISMVDDKVLRNICEFGGHWFGQGFTETAVQRFKMDLKVVHGPTNISFPGTRYVKPHVAHQLALDKLTDQLFANLKLEAGDHAERGTASTAQRLKRGREEGEELPSKRANNAAKTFQSAPHALKRGREEAEESQDRSPKRSNSTEGEFVSAPHGSKRGRDGSDEIEGRYIKRTNSTDKDFNPVERAAKRGVDALEEVDRQPAKRADTAERNFTPASRGTKRSHEPEETSGLSAKRVDAANKDFTPAPRGIKRECAEADDSPSKRTLTPLGPRPRIISCR